MSDVDSQYVCLHRFCTGFLAQSNLWQCGNISLNTIGQFFGQSTFRGGFLFLLQYKSHWPVVLDFHQHIGAEFALPHSQTASLEFFYILLVEFFGKQRRRRAVEAGSPPSGAVP